MGPKDEERRDVPGRMEKSGSICRTVNGGRGREDEGKRRLMVVFQTLPGEGCSVPGVY